MDTVLIAIYATSEFESEVRSRNRQFRNSTRI